MQFSGCGERCFSLKGILVYCVVLPCVLLAGCEKQGLKTPVQVCETVTKSLLGFELPEKIAVSEQEIHGERIVVHLNFKRPADNYPVKSICVYGVDLYKRSENGILYKQAPSRLAINNKQVSENDLLEAISKSGLE